MNEKSDSTNQISDSSSNTNSGIKTEMDSGGYDPVGFTHLPQVQRIVKLERESSFGKLPIFSGIISGLNSQKFQNFHFKPK